MNPDSMTTRERFNRVLQWQKPDRVPNMDFGYWPETLNVWKKQGLPDHIQNDIVTITSQSFLEILVIVPITLYTRDIVIKIIRRKPSIEKCDLCPS